MNRREKIARIRIPRIRLKRCMKVSFCRSKIFLLVRDASQLNQKPGIARRLSKAGVKCELGLVPFLQPSQSEPSEKIKIGRLARGTSGQFGGFLPMPGVERALRRRKTSLIRSGILRERGEAQRQHCD